MLLAFLYVAVKVLKAGLRLRRGGGEMRNMFGRRVFISSPELNAMAVVERH